MEIKELLNQEIETIKQKAKLILDEINLKKKELKFLNSDIKRKETAKNLFLGEKIKKKKLKGGEKENV
jgi:hypothetical protein